MTRRYIRGCSTFVLLTALVLSSARPASAQINHPDDQRPSDTRIALLNAGLTAGMAVVRGLTNGKIDRPSEALETTAWSAVGGYGFYHSKRLVGNGRFITGTALAYASTSLVENTARGQHPLSFVRFGTGPIDLRVRTPFAGEEIREKTPLVNVQFNALTTLSFVLLPFLDFEASLYKGTMFHRSPKILGREESYPRRALAFNRTVVLGPAAPRSDLRHELIHTIQSLQVSAVTPYYTLSDVGVDLPRPASFLGWDVQIDWLYGALGLMSMRADYHDRWVEIEAYSLYDAAGSR